MTDVLPAWWISWYTEADLTTFEMHSPWWLSGAAFDPDRDILVAAVRAADEDAAWDYVRSCYDDQPAEIQERFIEPLDDHPVFTGRFPKSDWMAWEPDGRTCNCPEHAPNG